MERSKIVEKILEILGQQLESCDEQISETSAFISELDMSSLDIILMVCDLEEAFDIVIQDKDIQSIITVGDADYIYERIN